MVINGADGAGAGAEAGIAPGSGGAFGAIIDGGADTRGGTGGVAAGALAIGAGAGREIAGAGVGAGDGFLAANSSRSADALMLSTVLETDFTSGAMILRSLRSAIISLLSRPSWMASWWMRILMQWVNLSEK